MGEFTDDPQAAIASIRSRFAPDWPAEIYCGAGWYSILIELDRKLIAAAPTILYCQIKEKFGGLRVYLSEHDIRAQQWVREAEASASKACEICGNPGQLRSSRPWIRTLCDACEQASG
ncbi:hypothetical protein [Mycobacteroides abscessus]|uniref:hypothetical protein n=1 Tax=Mycobacteroides abscessus TaxID=36809 RepID=UPI001041DC31|nr:hypothetical protein [Mycobacteroides abscessus]